MIPLPRSEVLAQNRASSPRFDQYPLQTGLHGDPWLVAVASMLLCRTRREQAEAALRALYARWPTPADLARSDTEELERVVKPCGLYRNRARQLQRMSTMWDSSSWEDMRDLPGVGKYVADAVGLFCFGCTDLESGDSALEAYVRRLQDGRAS